MQAAIVLIIFFARFGSVTIVFRALGTLILMLLASFTLAILTYQGALQPAAASTIPPLLWQNRSLNVGAWNNWKRVRAVRCAGTHCCATATT